MRALRKEYSPGKRKSARLTNYYYKREKGSTKHTRHRGKYFVRFRRERELVKILTSSPPGFTGERRERTIVRQIYYSILPKLLAFIEYPPDRVDVLSIERCYYDYLNIDRISRGSSRRINRLSWKLRYMPYRSRVSLESSGWSARPGLKD